MRAISSSFLPQIKLFWLKQQLQFCICEEDTKSMLMILKFLSYSLTTNYFEQARNTYLFKTLFSGSYLWPNAILTVSLSLGKEFNTGLSEYRFHILDQHPVSLIILDTNHRNNILLQNYNKILWCRHFVVYKCENSDRR